MAITTDAFGNTFAGNFIAGDSWEPNDLLAVIRSGLGSNDRANIDRFNISRWRIDWRPNESTTDETLTGVIATPTVDDIDTGSPSGRTLTANSRFGISVNDGTPSGQLGFYLLGSGSTFIGTVATTNIPTFSGAGVYHAVVREDSVSAFIRQGATYAFISTGLLQNSPLSFPANIYGMSISVDTASRIRADVNTGTMTNMFAATAVANYAHNDGSPTTNEVELYLRRQSDDQQLGFVPNIIKITVDGALVAPSIGDILTCDFSAATGFYSGYGTRKLIVVGRLGNTSETDLTGDFLGMLVAG